MVQLLLEYGADIEAKDHKKMTALHFAAEVYWKEHQGTVQLRLDHGADIEAKDRDNMTALQHSAATAEPWSRYRSQRLHYGWTMEQISKPKNTEYRLVLVIIFT